MRSLVVIVRRMSLAQGLEVVALDGTIATLVPGPHSRGIRITVRVARVVTTRALAKPGLDGQVGRGRPASEATVELRKVLAEDVRRRTVRGVNHYVQLLSQLRGSSRGALQVVRREIRRVVGRRRSASAQPRGRLPSARALALRELLQVHRKTGQLGERASYVRHLVEGGMTPKAARSLVSRELARLPGRLS